MENRGSEPCLLHASPVAHCFGSLHGRAEKSLASQKGLLALRDRRTFTHLSIPKGFPLLKAKKKYPQPPQHLQAAHGSEGRGLAHAGAAAMCGSVQSQGNTGMSREAPWEDTGGQEKREFSLVPNPKQKIMKIKCSVFLNTSSVPGNSLEVFTYIVLLNPHNSLGRR